MPISHYLAGDAVKDYPNLANIPSFHWKNVANAGAIYGVPVPNTVFLNAKYVNQTLLDQLGMSSGPKTLDEMKQLMKAFTRPQDNLYATAYATGGSLEETYIKELFRVPNNWRLDPGGKLLKDLESEERKHATERRRHQEGQSGSHQRIAARAEFPGRTLRDHRTTTARLRRAGR